MGCARRRFTLPRRSSAKAAASTSPASCAVSTPARGSPGDLGLPPQAGLSTTSPNLGGTGPTGCKQLDIWLECSSWGGKDFWASLFRSEAAF